MSPPTVDVRIRDGPVCRICYEPCDTVALCKCTGTMKYVHDECLNTWIRISQRTTCELCNAPFDNKDEDCSQCINNVFYTSVNIMLIVFLAFIVVIFVFEVV